MPTRRRADELTRVSGARRRDEPVVVPRDEYERNPNRWRVSFPVTDARTGQVTSYVARSNG